MLFAGWPALQVNLSCLSRSASRPPAPSLAASQVGRLKWGRGEARATSNSPALGRAPEVGGARATVARAGERADSRDAWAPAFLFVHIPRASAK